MKNLFIIILASNSLLISCAGNSPETDTTEDTSTVQTDTVSTVESFSDFKAYVNSLEYELYNVDSAFAHYEKMKINFSADQKDSSLFVLRDFLLGFELTDEDVGDLTEERQKEIEKEYGNKGFEVWYVEGYPFLVPDIKFLEQKFKNDISADLDDYLDVVKKVDKQITSDAAVVIEWSDLADMLIICEEFLAENTESKYTTQVIGLYQERVNLLMWGLDNTPVINNWSTDTTWELEEMVSEVYQKLIKDDKHKTGKIIADHLAWLETKNFHYEYEEVEYISTEEIKMYLGIQ